MDSDPVDMGSSDAHCVQCNVVDPLFRQAANLRKHCRIFDSSQITQTMSEAAVSPVRRAKDARMTALCALVAGASCGAPCMVSPRDFAERKAQA